MKTQLVRGAEIRIARAAVKASVAEPPMVDGYHRLADLIEHSPEEIIGARVVDALEWVYKSQSTTRRRLARAAGVSFETKIGTMTDRQRVALVTALREIK